ncbi:MAG TPA: hypothetical protein VG326_13930 [Tepidisphaeraceae bacterium]|jgi:hypothetical protein|nr:hypothetical protein [Tepidisphaeraceae bacterium]
MPSMTHFAGNCLLPLITIVFVWSIFVICVLLPIDFWQSLRSGSIGFQDKTVRRSRQPIRYWLAMLTIIAFFLWKGIQ